MRQPFQVTQSVHLDLSPEHLVLILAVEQILGVHYPKQIRAIEAIKQGSKRPLTLAEKTLYSHLLDTDSGRWNIDKITRGKTILELRPDRVACHDATATMALLQFISADLPRVMVPTTVHSDHLIISENGAEKDMQRATTEHAEVYDFLSSASKKYGIGFWKPGSGIIHTVIFENYAMYVYHMKTAITITDNFGT